MALVTFSELLPAGLDPMLALALVGLSFVWASTRGAYAIAPAQLWQVLLQAVGAAPSAEQAPEYLVFINIRLPRLLMGVAAGAGLGLAGALMQGLFRNPLADPGLIGVSSGAALAAGVTIVLGGRSTASRNAHVAALMDTGFEVERLRREAGA